MQQHPDLKKTQTFTMSGSLVTQQRRKCQATHFNDARIVPFMGLKGKSVLSIKCGVTNHSRDCFLYRFFQKEKIALCFKEFLALKTLVVKKEDTLTFRVIGNPPCHASSSLIYSIKSSGDNYFKKTKGQKQKENESKKISGI